MTAPIVILNQPEVIYSNFFPFVALPEAILRFTTKQVDADRIADGLALQWPHRYLRNGTFLSLVAPPPKNEDARFLVPFGGVSWRDVDRVGGLSTDRLLIELLNKHLAWKLRTLGLKQMVEGRSYATVYFPESLVPKNRLPLQLPNQRKTWVTTCGRLRSGAGHFRYNLAFALEARRLDDGHFAQMGLKAQIRDDIGNIVEGRHSFSRGRRVRRTWWNRQQLVRQAGIAAFLAQGDPSISLWEYANTDLAIAAAPSTFLIGTAIDESAPALSGEDVAPIEHDEVLLESERED